jgi:DNA repair ATPase RecN
MTARLSGKELAERRKARREKRERELKSQEKTKEKEQKQASERLQTLKEELEKLDILQSYNVTIYNKIDKLTKKAPKELVSDYSLNKINEHISSVKETLPDDIYLSKITIFEAAGDNPEYRDVIIALAEIGTSLNRCVKKIGEEKKKLEDTLNPNKYNLNIPSYSILNR